MISITSVTDNYILQPTLIAKHQKTLEWLSSTVLWKRELAFFQKILDQYAVKFSSTEDKQKVDHFQNWIIYYKSELIDSFSFRLRKHEKALAEMFESRDETKTQYITAHEGLMNELESLNKQFIQNKEELFSFIEKVM
jgi:hypothetical protein